LGVVVIASGVALLIIYKFVRSRLVGIPAAVLYLIASKYTHVTNTKGIRLTIRLTIYYFKRG